MLVFVIFTFLSFKTFLLFFVLLYKGLLEPAFPVLDNLCEVFGCSVITDFM